MWAQTASISCPLHNVVMESIAQLRAALQGEKFERRKTVWGYRYLRRGLSVYITALLRYTQVLPNHVTVTMLLVGIAAAAAALAGWLWFGLCLAYLNVVLDAVDGELARYKKIFSMQGIYLDRINHILIPGLFLLAFALRVGGAFGTPHAWVLALGALGALCLPVTLVSGHLHHQLYVRTYLKEPALFPKVREFVTAKTVGSKPLFVQGPLHLLAQILYQFGQFVMMILVFALGLAAEQLYLFTAGHPVLSWMVAGYGLFFILYMFREVASGYRSIERRIARLLQEPTHHG